MANSGHHTGEFPPGHRDLDEARRVNAVLATAHRAAVAALRAGRVRRRSAPACSCRCCNRSVPTDPEDVAAAATLRELMVDSHIDDLALGRGRR